MKIKTTYITLIFLAILPLCGFTIVTPDNLIQYQYQNTINTQTIIDLIDSNQIESAISMLQQCPELENSLLSFNKPKFDTLLANYKPIVISQLNTLIDQQDYIHASNILHSISHLYHTDKTILNLQEITKCKVDIQTEIYNQNITHIAVSDILSNPQNALHTNNPNHLSNEHNHLTPKEFYSLLLSLYNNNYVLIDYSQTYEIINNTLTRKAINLPSNKKPLVLHIDCNHNNYSNGYVDKIILDRTNNIAGYTTKAKIADRICNDNNAFSILENFVNHHPTFSYKNAKGVISLNTNNCVFGYNINPQNPNYKTQLKSLQKIISHLDSNNWSFAFAPNFNDTSSKNAVSTEFEKFNLLCEKLGIQYRHHIFSTIPTNNQLDFSNQVICTNNQIATYCNLSETYENKFYNPTNNYSKTKSSISNNSNWTKQPQQSIINNDYIYNQDNQPITHINGLIVERLVVSGQTLRQCKTMFTDLFDCNKVYDHSVRAIPFID